MRFVQALLLASLAATAVDAHPVLLISVDGLRPGDVIEAPARGFKLPVLRSFLADGAYATGVKNVLPTVTYPNHTTLITGVAPARHGIANNTVFDPLQKNLGGWYWYASDIKVPTLWDAVHADHKVVANLGWPVSVGAKTIDEDVPEYWRARNLEDLKLLRVLATPGLIEDLESATGMPLASIYSEEVDADEARAKFTAALITRKHPEFTTLHIVSDDHNEHSFGPGAPEVHAALERIDTAIGGLIAEARKAEPDLVVAIVSDHGFAPVASEVNLLIPFIEAGLVTYDADKHQITDWQAMPWGAGGSAAIVLAHPDDMRLQAKAGDLLDKLAAKPELGIEKVIGRKEIARRGGTGAASFWIDFKLGFSPGRNTSGPLVTPSSQKGTHGYFPDHKEMRATFLIAGPGVPRKNLGEIDMRAIAPTLAKILGVALPSADAGSLF